MKGLFLLLIIAFSTIGYAIEINPYTSHVISKDDWNTYRNKVVKELASTRKVNATAKTEVFTKELQGKLITVTFTNPDHLAYPSWVTEIMSISDNKLHLRAIGYYAGDKSAFVSFYNAIKEQQNTIRNGIQSEMM